jgi:hypothetical protein
MTKARFTSADEQIIGPMIALAGCSKQDRIVVGGLKGVELMLALHRRGYLGAAATATCGHRARQYGVALVDWRRRTTPFPKPREVTGQSCGGLNCSCKVGRDFFGTPRMGRVNQR